MLSRLLILLLQGKHTHTEAEQKGKNIECLKLLYFSPPTLFVGKHSIHYKAVTKLRNSFFYIS